MSRRSGSSGCAYKNSEAATATNPIFCFYGHSVQLPPGVFKFLFQVSENLRLLVDVLRDRAHVPDIQNVSTCNRLVVLPEPASRLSDTHFSPSSNRRLRLALVSFSARYSWWAVSNQGRRRDDKISVQIEQYIVTEFFVMPQKQHSGIIPTWVVMLPHLSHTCRVRLRSRHRERIHVRK